MYERPLTIRLKMFFKELWNRRPEILKKEYWVSDFPNAYHPECFRCNLGPKSCPSCEFRAWGENPGHICKDGVWVKMW